MSLLTLWRWLFGIILFLGGGLFWFGALAAHPFTTYGWKYERVRPIAAEWSVNLAALSFAALLLSGLLLFGLLKRQKRVWLYLFAGLTLLFASIDVYRIIWIEFVVLPQAGHEPRNYP